MKSTDFQAIGLFSNIGWEISFVSFISNLFVLCKIYRGLENLYLNVIDTELKTKIYKTIFVKTDADPSKMQSNLNVC